MFCLVSCSLLAWQNVSGLLGIFSSVFECLASELLFIMRLQCHGFLEHFCFILALCLGIAAYSSQFFGLLTMYICNHVFTSMKFSSRALLFFFFFPLLLHCKFTKIKVGSNIISDNGITQCSWVTQCTLFFFPLNSNPFPTWNRHSLINDWKSAPDT